MKLAASEPEWSWSSDFLNKAVTAERAAPNSHMPKVVRELNQLFKHVAEVLRNLFPFWASGRRVVAARQLVVHLCRCLVSAQAAACSCRGRFQTTGKSAP